MQGLGARFTLPSCADSVCLAAWLTPVLQADGQMQDLRCNVYLIFFCSFRMLGGLGNSCVVVTGRGTNAR